MAYEVKNANIFGRVGTGIGKGLADQVPKEIERYRLAEGLKKLGEKKDLDPWQAFTELASIPGGSPQLLQSGTELLKQRAKGQALSKFEDQPKPSPFPTANIYSGGQKPSNIPSLTQEEPFAKAQEGFIPRTEDQKLQAAGQRYNENQALFGNDPQKAIDYENQVDATNEKIAQANQIKHENLSKIQDNVVSRLKDQSNRLNTKVPADLYSQIEDKAIQDTKSKKEGGRGITEQQAMKEYGKKLDDASRLFSKVDEIGNWGITSRPAKETLRSIKDLQQDMEKLDQTDNFAKQLISKNKLSPQFAYANAEPVSRVPELNSFLKNLPQGNAIETLAETVYDIPGTMEIAPQLARFLKNSDKASPLAIAYELQKKGYDASAWLKYVTDHKSELNLKQRQSEQAATPINAMIPWNDWWLSSFTGIE